MKGATSQPLFQIEENVLALPKLLHSHITLTTLNKRCWIKASSYRHLTNDLLTNSWKANNNTSINSGGSVTERLERGLSARLVILMAWLHGGGGTQICVAHLPGVPHLHVNRPLFGGLELKPSLPRPLAGFIIGNPEFKFSATLVK